MSAMSKGRKELNRRKVVFRDEAKQTVCDYDEITPDVAWVTYKLDCLKCPYHDQSNPKSVNCRDNPYCIQRIGLEKFQKLLKEEQTNSSKMKKDIMSRRNCDETPCGLTNTGNFCYVNSFLQVWFNEPVFRQIIFDWRPSEEYQRPDPPAMDVQRVMDSLQQLFITLHTTPFEDTNVHEQFIKSLRLDNEQQDVLEFSLMLFNAFDRNLPRHPNGNATKSALNALYAGELKDCVRCQCGGKDSATTSPMHSIELIIEGYSTLQEALSAHFTPQLLEDFRCDACGERGNVVKQYVPSRLPKVLLFQLLRTVYDASSNGRRKIKTPILYPRILRASAVQEGLPAEEDFEYELFAVMIHEGSANSGHYYDVVKHPITGRWFKYNDEVVEALTKGPGYGQKKPPTSARNAPDMKDCYGLMYRRKDETPVKFVLPPDEICSRYINLNESEFVDQTQDNIKKSKKRMNEVTKRYNWLVQMFKSLETHTDKCKNNKSVAFLPLKFLQDILEKELNRAKSITDEVAAETSANGVPARAKRAPRKNEIPRALISQTLNSQEIELCPHGCISLESVIYGDLKAVHRSTAESLLNSYCISITKEISGHSEPSALMTGEDICMNCLVNLRNEARAEKEMEADVKLAAKIIKEKSVRSSVSDVAKPETHFYVADKVLRNFHRLVEQEIHRKFCPPNRTSGVLKFMPRPKGESGLKLLKRKMDVSSQRHDSCAPKISKLESDEVEDDDRISGEVNAVVDYLVERAESLSPSTPRPETPNSDMDYADLTLDLPSENDKPEIEEEYKEDDNDIMIVKEVKVNGTTPSGSPSNGEDRPCSSNGAEDDVWDDESVVEFNDTLRCDHGGINLDEYRCAVSPAEWNALKKYFDRSFEVPCHGALCQECLALYRTSEDDKKIRIQTLKNFCRDYGDMVRQIDKRIAKANQLGTDYTYGVCHVFVNNLSRLKRRCESSDFPSICQCCVLCKHGNPFAPIKNEANSEFCIVPLTETEWQCLVDFWTANITMVDQPGIEPIRITSEGIADGMCEECYAEYLDDQRRKLLMFESAPIFVKMQTLDDENVDVIPPSTGNNTKSTRRTQKNVVKVVMSSSNKIRDLKVKLYQKTHQSPNDQLLYKDGELLKDDSTLFEESIEPNNSEKPLVLIVSAYPSSSSPAYEETPAGPERGFMDTALIH